MRSGPVVMFSLGGTIAMAGHTDGGVVARLTGHDLVAGLGALRARPRRRGPRPGCPAERRPDLRRRARRRRRSRSGSGRRRPRHRAHAGHGHARGDGLPRRRGLAARGAVRPDRRDAQPDVARRRRAREPGRCAAGGGLGGGPGPGRAGRARQPGARRRARPQVAQHQPGGVHLARPRAGRAGGRGRAAVPGRRATPTDGQRVQPRGAGGDPDRAAPRHVRRRRGDPRRRGGQSPGAGRGRASASGTSPVRWPRRWARSPSGCRWC